MHLSFSHSLFRALRRPLVPCLLLFLYAAAIAAITWPWLATPASRVLSHWDPPFHAWKLTFAARALLSGHHLPPGGDTNVLYPQSGAFFFEALHWPQAVFAAPFLAAGFSPVLVYHLTLVFFWALSGVVFRWWLRVLPLREPFAALGGLFFVLVPYRVSYAVEFNMQLCFALPLLLGAIVLFFRRPSPGPVLLAAVAWWLQAVSELYQAVFVLLLLPFFVLPLFARDPALLRSWRRFWRPVLLGAAACAVLSAPFLLPYARTLGDGTLVRSLDEMRTHVLEPFSYVLPFGRHRFLPVPIARRDEMSVYPTLALLATALFALAVHQRRFRRANAIFAASLLFAAAPAAALHFVRGPLAEPLAHATAWAGAAAVALAILCLLRRDRSLRRAAAAGLGAAALAGLVLSFGPDLRDSAAGVAVDNPLFALFSPALSGFRVVSRFAVFPVLALCTAAAAGLARAADSPLLARLPRAARAALLFLFLGAFLFECVPPPIKTRPVRDVSSSAALAAFDALPGPKTLAIVPMGDRSLDSEHMLAIARHDRLSVWAWAGAFPRFSRNLRDAFTPQKNATADASIAADLLGMLWPEAFVLEDRRPFGRRGVLDWSTFLSQRFDLLAADPEFRLWRLRADPTSALEAVRLVRRDFAFARPHAVFTLSAPSPCRVWLDVNGVPLAVFGAGPDPATHELAVPPALFSPRFPVRYRFHAEGDAPFTLAGFALEPSDSPPAPLPDSAARPALPWLDALDALPPDAIPLNTRFSRGIELCGATKPEWHAPEGPGMLPTLRFRVFLRFPPGTASVPDLLLAPGYAKDGGILYKNPTSLKSVLKLSAFPFAAGRLVPVELSLPVLEHLPADGSFTLSLDILTPHGRHLRPRHVFTPVPLPVRHAPSMERPDGSSETIHPFPSRTDSGLTSAPPMFHFVA
jgi:hypothetical protein